MTVPSSHHNSTSLPSQPTTFLLKPRQELDRLRRVRSVRLVIMATVNCLTVRTRLRPSGQPLPVLTSAPVSKSPRQEPVMSTVLLIGTSSPHLLLHRPRYLSGSLSLRSTGEIRILIVTYQWAHMTSPGTWETWQGGIKIFQPTWCPINMLSSLSIFLSFIRNSQDNKIQAYKSCQVTPH